MGKAAYKEKGTNSHLLKNVLLGNLAETQVHRWMESLPDLQLSLTSLLKFMEPNLCCETPRIRNMFASWHCLTQSQKREMESLSTRIILWMEEGLSS